MRSRRMAQSLDLARLPRRKDVKLSIPRRKPDRRPHLDPASTGGREAYIAMPIELSDVVHAQILRSKRTAATVRHVPTYNAKYCKSLEPLHGARATFERSRVVADL